jgi:glycogen debranching enzyme
MWSTGFGTPTRSWERECTQIRTDNELFDQLLARGLRDLRALYTEMDGAGIVAAGIPWYVAAFGRDTLITSHQMLMLTPSPARASLQVLAEYQGKQVDDWRDEQPGKITRLVQQPLLLISQCKRRPIVSFCLGVGVQAAGVVSGRVLTGDSTHGIFHACHGRSSTPMSSASGGMG